MMSFHRISPHQKRRKTLEIASSSFHNRLQLRQFWSCTTPQQFAAPSIQTHTRNKREVGCAFSEKRLLRQPFFVNQTRTEQGECTEPPQRNWSPLRICRLEPRDCPLVGVVDWDEGSNFFYCDIEETSNRNNLFFFTQPIWVVETVQMPIVGDRLGGVERETRSARPHFCE